MGLILSGQKLPASRLNAGMANGEDGIKVFATSGTMTSATYVDLPGVSATSFSFTKQATGSKIFVAMRFEAFADVGNTTLRLGVRINGVDYDVALMFWTTANQYAAFAGWAYVAPGLAAGTYTVQARWKRTSGTGIINTNNAISELDVMAREVGV